MVRRLLAHQQWLKREPELQNKVCATKRIGQADLRMNEWSRYFYG
jgi:uncharacterized protein YecT (DUF1311 family)